MLPFELNTTDFKAKNLGYQCYKLTFFCVRNFNIEAFKKG